MTYPAGMLARLTAKVAVRPDGCWEWRGSTKHNGYGRVYVGGHEHVVHRALFELLAEPIPDGLDLVHRDHDDDCPRIPGTDRVGPCRHRLCVNPDHQEQRRRVPVAVDVNRGKETCPAGHPYDVQTGGRVPQRKCSACQSAERSGINNSVRVELYDADGHPATRVTIPGEPPVDLGKLVPIRAHAVRRARTLLADLQ